MARQDLSTRTCMVTLNILDGRVQNRYYGIPAFKNLMTASISVWGDWGDRGLCYKNLSDHVGDNTWHWVLVSI